MLLKINNFFSFLLENVSAEFSNPFPQAARLGSQQLWAGMGLAGAVLAGSKGTASMCSASEMPVVGQENFLF